MHATRFVVHAPNDQLDGVFLFRQGARCSLLCTACTTVEISTAVDIGFPSGCRLGRTVQVPEKLMYNQMILKMDASFIYFVRKSSTKKLM